MRFKDQQDDEPIREPGDFGTALKVETPRLSPQKEREIKLIKEVAKSLNKNGIDAYNINMDELEPPLRDYMRKKNLAPPGPFNPKMNNGFTVFRKCKLAVEKPLKFSYKKQELDDLFEGKNDKLLAAITNKPIKEGQSDTLDAEQSRKIAIQREVDAMMARSVAVGKSPSGQGKPAGAIHPLE